MLSRDPLLDVSIGVTVIPKIAIALREDDLKLGRLSRVLISSDLITLRVHTVEFIFPELDYRLLVREHGIVVGTLIIK